MTPLNPELEVLAKKVGHDLKGRALMLATAESCTGGWVAQLVTSVDGSSAWFERGFVTYSNAAKRELLGVSTTVLSRYGAVSEQTVRAMAEGALKASHADVTLAITGIAGPGGGTSEKPVGTVWVAWAGKKRKTVMEKYLFSGDRNGVREQAVAGALTGLVNFLSD
jgi:nicotinamide-nucleotide amidase